MIKKNLVRLKTFGNRKLGYFSDLGYDTSGEFFDVRIEHLSPGSREVVEVVCDYCGDDVNVTYKEYLRNISGVINKYACSKICGSLKAKETCLEKYGVENAMILEETQEKTKKTNKEKYGVEFIMQSSQMIQKSKQSIIDKYGVEHISKTENFKEKFKESMLKRWGVEYSMQSDILKEKSKKTNLKNIGVENPSQSSKIREKICKTNLEKWGNVNYLKTEDCKLKSKKTLLDKWGSDNIMKSELFRSDRFSISKDEKYVKYGFSGFSIMECQFGHNFEIHIDNYLKRINSKLPLCTVCYPISDQKSIKEKEVFKFIVECYKGTVLQSYRDALEIDIYIPDLKLGFEFNGLYWHSDIFKDKNYHLDKLNYFKEKEIRVFNIWEDDWIYKQNILKSQIRNLLGLSSRIGARSCQIKEIKDTNLVREFLRENHIQGGYNNINKSIGLFHKDELVSVMTFDHTEGRKKMLESEWCLSRFCNKLGFSIVGGASRLLKYFTSNYKPSRIVSYADKDWSQGSLYLELGFNVIYDTEPDYKYVINNIRKHKSGFKKSITGISESKLDLPKIWDCGKIKYEKVF
jgi:hypothetical protein